MRFVLAMAAALLSLPVLAQPAPVSVTAAWARATVAAGQAGAVYATIAATAPDRLTGISTPVATKAELHESRMDHGMMEMRSADLALAPGTQVHLSPGGYHIMLTGLSSPLKRGDHFPITLTFEHAGPVTTTVTIVAPGARQP
jgi:copper(I)-binding protein